MALTIGQTVNKLNKTLRDYIEAAYHISNEGLIQQRRELLLEPGVIHQQPYLESTPRYVSGSHFCDIGLPHSVLNLFETLSDANNNPVLHNPPWGHQSQALKDGLSDGKSMLVTTGTGSGKTECFLLPILGKLAREASANGPQFGEQSAVRALVMYPMNALVNDQLARLRLLFADPRVVDQFMEWSGRAARFARYTSRTLYPGVRTNQKDGQRLSVINKFYIDYLRRAAGDSSDDQRQAEQLVRTLKEKGKWPAKDNLEEWFGAGTHWKDSQGEYKRCVAHARDAELFTRHEVQVAPPDILVTNYSMLEYMLMRPLERPIFEQTASWLKNTDESFLLVVDEAHLYRGAPGAEVALLIRRLRSRLGIPPERMQVICTSASFNDPDYGIEFAAQLSGKSKSDFAPPIRGTYDVKKESTGNSTDAQLLADIDTDAFYAADTDESKLSVISSFIESKVTYGFGDKTEHILYNALNNYDPLGLLINRTMGNALAINTLGPLIFPDVDRNISERAVTSLIALGSYARRSPSEPGLLPCRVHAFYRGLAGIWACMDSNCSEIPESMRGGPTGKLYSQPLETCSCGARVLELFTCRHCGTAYARAYTENLEEPSYLWSEPGGAFRSFSGMLEQLQPLDLLIEGPPGTAGGELHDFDLITGELDPIGKSSRSRQVYISSNRRGTDDSDSEEHISEGGLYKPCAVCNQQHSRTRTSVQDHQTKGDEPFRALISKQIQVQPPNHAGATSFAPQQGRKVLVFSDSRQTAARLAPNLQKYSMQDVMRPLLMRGFQILSDSPMISPYLNLNDAYLGVLLAATDLKIRLRPVLKGNESFSVAAEVKNAVLEKNALHDDHELFQVYHSVSSSSPPASLLAGIVTCIRDKYYGLESLGLASVIESPDKTSVLENLPDIPGVAETVDQKLALARFWLRTWATREGFWFNYMPPDWYRTEVKPHSGKFQLIDRFLDDRTAKRLFKGTWLNILQNNFCDGVGQTFRLSGTRLSLNMSGEWGYCSTCRTSQRPFPGNNKCINCGKPTVEVIDPSTDPAFSTRKGFYRASTVALDNNQNPMSLVAAEHTAQLNSSNSSEVFSRAEEHELLFQDVDLGPDENTHDRTAIDILSCTTTMEVGIDIGALSGVALRNMPPTRANYQQRSGRAGRRGNAVATVTAFGSADSHDEHYFSCPDDMISGPVEDPHLTMDNVEITRRHVTAFLFQRYHQEKLPNISPEDQPQLFEVLGSVSDFLNRNKNLNRWDFLEWMEANQTSLKNDIEHWLPCEVSSSDLLDNLIEDMTHVLNVAIGEEAPDQKSQEGDAGLEVLDEIGEEHPPVTPDNENLLNRMLYKGILPKYAFPTDVATFHVFKPDSNAYHHEFRYTPSQSLSVALTQYAPGKEVWIDNKLWLSGAIYSTMKDDRGEAWQKRQLYFECQKCHHAETATLEEAERKETRDCPACGNENSLGPARFWFRPPGFAHRINIDEVTTPDDQPAKSYATRAKLMAPTPDEEQSWLALNKRIRIFALRDHLLVTNRGPREEGYNYCTTCGLIDPAVIPGSDVMGGHRKPYPSYREHNCAGGYVSTGIVLGTDFRSDVLLISINVDGPIRLIPGFLATNVVMRTISEAVSMAGCTLLELDQSELQAEYRPALSQDGQEGLLSEIFVYDTLPGGAGFSRLLKDKGLLVMERALQLLEDCPGKCDRSCYRCLRSYKNKFEHDLLDRHLGASLLRYLLTGEMPSLSQSRVDYATTLLFEAIQRQTGSDLNIKRSVPISFPGLEDVVAPIYIERGDSLKYVIGIHNPLTPDLFADPILREWEDIGAGYVFRAVDELIIRRNLPKATRDILDLIGS